MRVGSNEVKKLDGDWVRGLFKEEHLILAVNTSVGVMRYLGERIKQIEGVVKSRVKLRPEFEGLLTLPGVGEILGLTIMLEVGDIRRFPEVGNYASYCRCVRSSRISNEKRKGEGNRKNGNKYLSWAYVEAANFAIRDYPEVQRYYQRKAAKSNGVVAIKAISHKLSRASYYIMRDQVDYDPEKLFYGEREVEEESSLLRKSRRKKFLDFPRKAHKEVDGEEVKPGLGLVKNHQI